MRTLSLLFLCSLFILNVQGQDTAYVRDIISKLASPEMHGRGYEFEGDKIAANYLAVEAEKAGLSMYGESWFQPYTMSANTHPGKLELKVDGKALIPGVDFLVAASSPRCRGSYKLAWINKKVVEHEQALENMLGNDLSDYILIIDTVGIHNEFVLELIKFIIEEKPTRAKAVIQVVDGNLTYRPSTIKKKFPSILVKRGAITVENKTVNLRIKAKFKKKYQTQNVIGHLLGKVDTSIVFTAHYDHLGRMGKATYFPGANDNASGSAMLLNMAKELARKGNNHYSYTFIWFSGEEAGILGSKHYAENPVYPLSKIKYLFNLDMVGSGDKGIKIVNGGVFTDTFDRIKLINDKQSYLATVAARGAAANSDHYFFYEKGVRAFFIYTMGEYKEYHNIYDREDRVPLSGYNGFFKLMRDFIEEVEATKI